MHFRQTAKLSAKYFSIQTPEVNPHPQSSEVQVIQQIHKDDINRQDLVISFLGLNMQFGYLIS